MKLVRAARVEVVRIAWWIGMVAVRLEVRWIGQRIRCIIGAGVVSDVRCYAMC